MNEATLKNSLAIPHKVDSYCTSVKKKKKNHLGKFFFLGPRFNENISAQQKTSNSSKFIPTVAC